MILKAIFIGCLIDIVFIEWCRLYMNDVSRWSEIHVYKDHKEEGEGSVNKIEGSDICTEYVKDE